MQKRDLRTCNKTGRRLFSLLCVFLLCAQLSAHSSIMSGEKDLRVVKTKWFDIIYPARCEQSASILYEKADALYDEVTEQYGLTPSFRMPVVITPAVERFNAFWTSVPYNHIAIYDTGASGSGELAVFSETLLSTFRHELTHAVTFNMKSGFWRIIDKVFGDCVVPGMLTVTTGMAEGATLTSESAAGEGRLNDEYSRHYVKQAKIENAFPSYHDVSGASDITPGNAPYYFNGAFHQWLQDNYGLSAYADFWYRVVNGDNFTISGAFKKAFKIKLTKAWKQFKQDYEVPAVPANPVKAGLVQDFFEPGADKYSRMNDAGSVYASLSTGGDRLVWVDRIGNRVFAAEKGKEADYKELFSQNGLTSARLSSDGRFLALSYYSGNGVGTTARVKIYDFENGHFYSVKETGLKEAAVVKNGGGWYLVAQKYISQHYSIEVSQLVLSGDGRRVTGCEPVAEVVMGVETNPYAFTDLGDGRFAYLKKQKLSYSLCISSVDSTDISLLKEYVFPEGMAVRSLSYKENYSENGSFYFSYAQKGTLPRFGRLDEATGQLFLSDSDISGGVFEPVFWDDKIVYIGEFYRQSRLLCMEEKTAACESDLPEKSEKPEESAQLLEPESSFTPLNSSPYISFPYLLRGILIPASVYTTEYFGCNADYASTVGTSYLGFTYITANPWTEGSSELYTLTAGWNTLSNSYGIDLQISKGFSTSLFQSFTELKSEFDSEGWKQGGGRLQLSSSVEVGKVSSITISNDSDAFFGRQDKRLPANASTDITDSEEEYYTTCDFWNSDKIGITAPANDTIYYTVQNITSLQYSNIHRTGPGRFEYGGFGLGVAFGARYDSDLNEKRRTYVNATAVSAVMKISIPHLLPFESKYGLTYNLPLRLNTTLFPSSSPRSVFDASAETTLFSVDIQKAVPVLTAIFLKDFNISAGYTGAMATEDTEITGFQNAQLGSYFEEFKNGKGRYTDAVYTKLVLDMIPNVGIFAKPAYTIGVVSTFSYVINTPEDLSPKQRLKLTLALDLKF